MIGAKGYRVGVKMLSGAPHARGGDQNRGAYLRGKKYDLLPHIGDQDLRSGIVLTWSDWKVGWINHWKLIG